MGVCNLMRLIQETAQGALSNATVAQCRGKTLAIDANIYVYKCMAQRPFYDGRYIVRMLRLAHWMRRRDIEPIFVFDGQRPLLAKKRELSERRERKRRNVDRYDDVCEGVAVLERTERRWKHIRRLARYTSANVRGHARTTMRDSIADALLFALEDSEATFFPRRLMKRCADALLLLLLAADNRSSSALPPLQSVLRCISLPRNAINWIDIVPDERVTHRWSALFKLMEAICERPVLECEAMDRGEYRSDRRQRWKRGTQNTAGGAEAAGGGEATFSHSAGRLFEREKSVVSDPSLCAHTVGVPDPSQRLRVHTVGVPDPSQRLCAHTEGVPGSALGDTDCVTFVALRCTEPNSVPPPHLIERVNRCWHRLTHQHTSKSDERYVLPLLFARMKNDARIVCVAPSAPSLLMHMDTFLNLHSSRIVSDRQRHHRRQHASGSVFEEPLQSSSSTRNHLTECVADHLLLEHSLTSSTARLSSESTDAVPSSKTTERQRDAATSIWLSKVPTALAKHNGSDLFACIAAQQSRPSRNEEEEDHDDDKKSRYVAYRDSLTTVVDTHGGPTSADSALFDTLMDSQYGRGLPRFVEQHRFPLLHRSPQCVRKRCVAALSDVAADCSSLHDALIRLRRWVIALESQTVRVHYDQVNEVKRALRLRGERVVDAPHEAEQHCAALCLRGEAYAVVSDDTDAIPFGAPIVLRKCRFEDNAGDSDTFAQRVDCTVLLSEWGIDRQQLVDLCIAIGCDFCASLRDYAFPLRVLQAFLENPTIEALVRHPSISAYCSAPLRDDWKQVERARRLFLNAECDDMDDMDTAIENGRNMEQLKRFLRDRHCLRYATEYLESAEQGLSASVE